MAMSSLYGAALGAGISLLSNPGTVPYGSQIGGALNQAGNDASNIQDASGSLTSLGQQQIGAYNNFAPTAASSVNNYLNLLNSNPYTDSFSAGQLAQATNGSTANFAAQRANLTSSLAARGLAGDGGSNSASSMLAGGLAGIGSAQAAYQSNAQNTLAQNAIQQRYANLAQASNVAQNYASTLYGQGIGATQAGIGGYGSAGGLSLGAASGYESLSNNQQAYNQAYDQQLESLGGSLGSAAGGGIPGIGGGASGGGGISSAISPQVLQMAQGDVGSTNYGGGLGGNNPYSIGLNPNSWRATGGAI